MKRKRRREGKRKKKRNKKEEPRKVRISLIPVTPLCEFFFLVHELKLEFSLLISCVHYLICQCNSQTCALF